MRSGSTARQSARPTAPSGSTSRLVANSAADSNVSSRPPLASELASSSSTRRTGTVPPGTPGANRGRSASGHSMVIHTGLLV
ncbi:hypothetical protein, partial [Mycobacterium asiaticum]|uniref:hypothetical protein n=1 Tax=Mycobacterium asiaticum TaxID=1790 RepID=UPI0039C09E42